VHESADDLGALQLLLDRSYASAGSHLRSILTPVRRVSADELADRLTGMRLLALATVTADGRPLVGPVDGIFFRGSFHFGTAPDAVRYRHILARPQVSATHLPGEEFAVTVHGRAVPLNIRGADGAALRETLLEVYVPRYGPEFEQFLDRGSGGPDPPRPPVYARIEAARMFAIQVAPP
jgi:hypothetical protein